MHYIHLPETAVKPNTEPCVTEDYELVYHKPKEMVNVNMHYCPGCAHSLIHKLLMEVVHELEFRKNDWCCSGRMCCFCV